MNNQFHGATQRGGARKNFIRTAEAIVALYDQGMSASSSMNNLKDALEKLHRELGARNKKKEASNGKED